MTALALGAALAVVCVLAVAIPFLREPEARDQDDRLAGVAPETRRALELAERRDRALLALKELEFDHRTGKISDEDYRTLLTPLRREAADALKALEPRVEGRHERAPSPT